MFFNLKQWSRYVLMACWACSGCAPRIISASKLPVRSSYCEPGMRYYYAPDIMPTGNTDSLLQHLPDECRALSAHDLLLANATGVLPLVKQLVRATGDSSREARLQALALQTRIQHLLLLSITETDGMAAELDCEGERADQLAGYLDNINSNRNNRITAASIIVSSAAAIGAIVANGKGTQNAIGIGGAVLGAGLGALLIHPRGARIMLEHTRNLLSPVWYNRNDSTAYPPMLWYILNEKSFSNSRQVSLVQSIKSRWMSIEFDNKPDASKEQLLFGRGGIYDADDLHRRANMLNQLQATVRSVNQDLQSLIASLDEITHGRGQ